LTGCGGCDEPGLVPTASLAVAHPDPPETSKIFEVVQRSRQGKAGVLAKTGRWKPTARRPEQGSPSVRYWSVLFALAAIFSVGAFAYAPFSPDWWLPNPSGNYHHVVSTFGREIDSLFVIILAITGIAFIGTQVALVWATYKFADEVDAEGRPVRKADYYHGSQRLEVIWTIIPAAILVFIALYQMGTWASIKFRSAAPKVPPLAEITARQFQWVIRYPGPDGRLRTKDDLVTVNDLHLVRSQPETEEGPALKNTALIYLKSDDVLHSFFLPHMRIKQDAVPGLTIPVWFDVDTAGSYELVCAELCGWGHYKMRGKVTVHETQEEFQEWLDGALAEQNRSQLTMASAPEGRTSE
jgi:cytochrome c oxidase subunit 2